MVAPIYWLVIASSKNTSQLFSTSTFLPPSHLNWASNLRSLFSYNTGDFKWWFLNSVVYAAGDRHLCDCRFDLGRLRTGQIPFQGAQSGFRAGAGSLIVPATALVVPLFLLEHDVHLTNTYQGVILPLLVYPFGVYFMSIFSADAVPDTLIDSCRIDGAGELSTFWRVGRPILMPGMVTLFLLSFIGTWNNYFLPLVLLGTETKFPLTVGLSAWASDLNLAGAGQPLYPEVILGSLISVLPMLILFPFLQKYVARGLTLGAIAGE